MVACGLGLGALVTGVPALRWAIKVAGVAYMLWLALKLARSGQLAQVDAAGSTSHSSQGVGLQFLNIKAWMLALTLTAGWVVNAAGQPAANPGERLAIISAIMVVFAFSSNFAYALAGLAAAAVACARRAPALVQPRAGARAGGHRGLDAHRMKRAGKQGPLAGPARAWPSSR